MLFRDELIAALGAAKKYVSSVVAMGNPFPFGEMHAAYRVLDHDIVYLSRVSTIHGAPMVCRPFDPGFGSAIDQITENTPDN